VHGTPPITAYQQLLLHCSDSILEWTGVVSRTLRLC
jgi:hypothetical protein